MSGRWKLIGERLRSSLWPIPVLMLLAAVLLLQVTRAIDAQVSGDDALRFWWLHSGSGDDARNLLSTLATAVITITSLVLSITIVALTLAANQFGSRLVRAYMRDGRTKACIGLFLLTIAFCLLALRVVTKDMAPAEVPHVTVTTALALALACVVVLVLFLHLVSRSIIADEVIRAVAQELEEAIDALPDATDHDAACPPEDQLLPPQLAQDGRLLRSPREGYVQEIHYEKIAAHAEQAGLVVRLEVSAGDYMCLNGWLGWVYPADRCSQQLMQVLAEAVVVGSERTPVQDLAFAVRHLVDIALRALSPGINDANTALVVVDRLRGALARVLGKRLPTHAFRSARGDWVVVGRRREHAKILADSLRPIRAAAAAQPWVIVSMLEALAKLSEHLRDDSQAKALLAEADLLVEHAHMHPVPPSEAARMERAHEAVRRKTEQLRGTLPELESPPPALRLHR